MRGTCFYNEISIIVFLQLLWLTNKVSNTCYKCNRIKQNKGTQFIVLTDTGMFFLVLLIKW